MGGVLAKVFNKKGMPETRIVMVGLDNAGKTTILKTMKNGKDCTDGVENVVPTVGFNVETVKYKKVSFVVWDVGGQDKIRPLWKHYYQDCQAVVYVVDSADNERLEEAAAEVQKMFKEEELADVIFLFLANKQDMPEAASPDKIKDIFQLESQNRKWHIEATVAPSGKGIENALEWLAVNLQQAAKSRK
eukprot:TRINITY_DN9991_c0_g1_i1.p1 TRINITY_DN9991_c0_g1~~TRINITY_DN9991_c0_g1_i1.p1  ORF type:complete len:189 (+),score=46.18 TRINITY_DN9991_c0_g1_i1:89-655(+)